MAPVTAFTHVLAANETGFFVVLGLAALDLLVGAGRAVAHRQWSSAVWRSTAGKLVQELGLPMVLAILAVADSAFAPLVPAALVFAIIAEATSVLEQASGKAKGPVAGLVADVLQMLGRLHLPGDGPPPTGGTADGHR
jgi:hypothetical protein